MKKAFVVVLGVALLCLMAADAGATRNSNAKVALHNAGAHNAKGNTCAFTLSESECGLIETDGGSAGARNDIYVIAVDVIGITVARYGLTVTSTATPDIYFYSFNSCAELDFPTTGWPGDGEAIVNSWGSEQPGPHVTCGILDIYVYGTAQTMCTDVDFGIGRMEFCDGTQPNPICVSFDASNPDRFGCIGYNGNGGFNPCSIVPVENKSWGAVKSLYR